MDYKKRITFEADLNISNIGPKIEDVKKQFNEVADSINRMNSQAQMSTRLSQQGQGGTMSAPKPEDIQKGRKSLDLFIKEQAQDQEKLYKKIDEQKDKLEKLQNIKKNILKNSKEELSIDEKRNSAREVLLRLEDQYEKKNAILNESLNLKHEKSTESGGGGGIVGGPGGSDIGPPSKGFFGGYVSPQQEIPKDFPKAMDDATDRMNEQKFAGIKKSISAGLTGLTGIAGVLSASGEIMERLAGFPMRLEQATGSAVEGLVGRDLSALQSGQAKFETSFMPERARASEMAKEKAESNKRSDRIKGLGATAAILLGAGSIAAAPFTGGMSLTGLAVAGTAIAGGAAGLSNDRSRKGIFGGDEYEKLIAAEQTKDSLETWQALQKQNPQKRIANEELQRNYATDLQTQRMTGMSDEALMGKGSFKETANLAGFNPDLARAKAVQIQAAGGSTRGMKGLSTLGLQAERGFDLTNAGSVLGNISGGAGGAQASEQIFKKLMEESIKAGLDKSDFREEQRRYAEMTSEILSQAGVKSAEDAEKVLQGFSKYLGEQPTVKEIAGAKSAYEEAQGFSAETSGRGGALQFAAMMKRPSLRALGAEGAAGLMEMPEKDLLPSNQYVITEAVKAGVSPEQLIKDTKEAKEEKKFIEVGLDPVKQKKLDEYFKKRGITDAKPTETEQLSMATSENKEDRQMLEQYQKRQEAPTMKSAYEGAQKREAVVGGFRQIETGEATTAAKVGPAENEFDKAMGKQTGRIGDKVTSASGVESQVLLENFRSMKEVITPVNTGLREFIQMLMDLKTASDFSSNQKENLKTYMGSQPFKAVNQNQGSKPRQ